VRPGEFEAVFGPGVRFRRATLEVVPASVPVTGGVIERHLPWLVGMTTNLAGTRFRSTNDIRERLPPAVSGDRTRDDHERERPPPTSGKKHLSEKS
jgi:hypothetical protein